MPEPKRVVVAGGGITGLSTAYRVLLAAREAQLAIAVTGPEAGAPIAVAAFASFALLMLANNSS